SGESRWIGLAVEMASSVYGDEVRIKVSDRGLGITPSELAHIFEPFYRGKEVVAGQIHGNGLGLSLVKHIVEAHGGRVAVESKFGQGSVFTLHLPAKPTEELSVPSAQEAYEQTNFAR
ncbi:MAG: HAMP domain-containing sensor histidine kinase, partial [Blastocatellia bacterium]